MNSKRYYILGITLFSIVFIILTLLLVCNFDSNKELSKIKDKSNINKKQFGMYIENENGEYIEYTGSDYFPAGYGFNSEKSYCVDNKDNIVNGVINYVNGKVTVTSNKTLYCYLYFLSDNEAPEISINVIDNYYTSAKLSIISNEDGTYCVNTSSTIGDTNNCVLEGSLIKDNVRFTGEFLESNIYYVHIKDLVGNETISEALNIKVLYQKVEYIESSGTQYIDTGFIPNQDTRIDIVATPLSKNNAGSGDGGFIPYGSGKSYNSQVFEAYSQNQSLEFNYGNTNVVLTTPIELNQKIIISHNKNVINYTIGENTYSYNFTYTSFTSPYTMTLFAIHRNVVVAGKSRIYLAEIYDNGNLIRNMIPVYRILDNVIGMLDEVNMVFYTNAGTGTFAKGDDINLDSPTVVASVIGNNSENSKITFVSDKTGTYCINTSGTRMDMNNCVYKGSVKANEPVTTNEITTNGIYYIHVEDDVGNIGVSNNVLIGREIGHYLLSNQTTGLNTYLDGGLYRYQGTAGNVDNYICFGTSDKNTCLNNTDAHMYRIIGINSNNQVKLLKNEALNSQFYWDTSTSANNAWPNSSLFNKLNGSSFLTNATYMPSEWNDKIADYLWKYGDISTFKDTAVNIYNIESGWSNQVSAKIGLIYLHDYYYAYQNGGLACGSNTTTCKQSWMNMSNCDSKPPSIDEWYISHYNSNKAYFMNTSGGIGYDSVGCYLSARPVFYLKSNIQYVSGTGTLSDPFIIGVDVPVDTAAPTVTASAISNNSSSPKISIKSNEAGTYCVNTQSTPTNFSNCVLTGSISANTSITTSTLSASGTYYVHVKDGVGNIGISNMIDIFISNTGVTIGKYILANPTSGLNTTLEGELYRYQGTNDTVNNYICFGTSDKDTCLANTDVHMYRIIGVDSSNQVKLIKKTSLGNKNWSSSSTSSPDWNNSLIFSYINGSSYLGSTTYVPSGWQNLIANTVWKYETYINIDQSAYAIYGTETSSNAPTVTAKIALMYLHDYYYSYQSGGLNCSTTGSYSICKNSWLNPKHENLYYEYTMIRSNYDSGDGTKWIYYISDSGYANKISANSSIPIRPVFYLTNSVNYVSGSGTLTDPFIIS